MLSRTGNDWQTPEEILTRVRRVAPIHLDPCTFSDNPTGARSFFTLEDDGLKWNWGYHVDPDGLVFVNPPYGRGQMRLWAPAIDSEAQRGTQIIALTRGDTSTSWARLLLERCDAVCFPPRIKFKGAQGSPNFANLLFYYGPRSLTFALEFETLGPIWMK